ncbi:MAG: hypothetical protein AAF583_03180 [Pseudomonadota bacterium]
MTTSYLFRIPTDLQPALAVGEISRFGTVLKNNDTGQIVAHLQETGLAQNFFDSISSGPLAPATAISSIAGNVQMAQIKQMLQFMQLTQFATLGASVAGIGVSAIGIALMAKRVNALGKKIDGLEHQVCEGFRKLEAARTRDMLTALNGIVTVAEHNLSVGCRDTEWQRVGRQFMEVAERFQGEIVHLLSQDTLDEQLFDLLLSAWCQSNASGCRAFCLADDLNSAERFAETVSARYDSVFDEISPTVFFAKTADRTKEAQEPTQRPFAIPERIEMKVAYLREIQEVAATAPLLIGTLKSRGTSGREYVEAAEAEDRAPLVVLELG